MDSIINHIASTCGTDRNTITFYQKGGTVSHSLSDLDAMAANVAARLRAFGLREGDRIGIVAKNCIEWVLLDLAAIKIKLVTAGFEAGKFTPGPDLLEAYALKLIFTDQEEACADRILDIATIRSAAGEPGDPLPAQASYGPDEVTTIKFTSGSTGQPKGLAATVGSIDSSLNAVQALFGHGSGDKLLVFLPLSLLQQRYWIYSALHYGHDVVVSTYELAFYAIKREQPTVIMGVPAFFDAVRRQVEARARDTVTVAAGGSRDAEPAPDSGRDVERILGSRIRYLWTGSAPANPATLRFFHERGVPIYEGYGMNETCIVTKNHPGAMKIGSVGKVVAGKEVYLDDDNVVIVRSRFPVNTRYLYCSPGESEKIFRPNGDVRTGDLGHIDDEGYLYITGRADDVIVLANGKNVIVRPIEERVKAMPGIEECVLFGSGRAYLVAVISLAPDACGAGDVAAHIDRINGELAPDERIGRFVLSPESFTIENGLLTSQFKPKRKEILGRYGKQIESAYGATP